MTNLFTFKSKLFWPALAISLLPFVILAFLNSMAMDDYYFYDLYRTKGFWTVQHDLYLSWAGRYTSSLITGGLIVLDLPARFPFLPTLLYFACTCAALVYVIRSLRPIMPAGFFGQGWRIAAILFVLFLYVQADIATGFYWLSATTVYQTAFILFLLLIGTIIRKIGGVGPVATGAGRHLAPIDIFFFLLIILIVGCNEIMAVFLPFFLAALAAMMAFCGRPAGRWIWLGLAIAIGMGMVIFFTSGVINYRTHMMNSGTGFFAIVPIIGFRTVEVLFVIFKEPLFWGCAIAAFVSGIYVSSKATPLSTQPVGGSSQAPALSALASTGSSQPTAGSSQSPASSSQSPASSSQSPAGSSRSLDVGPWDIFRRKNVFLPGVAALLSIVLLSLAAFLLASRGSIPPRALNNLSDVTAFCLLVLTFLAGVNRGSRSPAPVLPDLAPAAKLAVLVAMLLASVNYADAWKTVGSGYFYHAVLADRDHLLKTAAGEHHPIAVVPSYDAALKEKIDQAFPHGVFSTAHDWLIQKPTLLVFYDGAGIGDAAYAQFYGLDSIVVKDK